MARWPNRLVIVQSMLDVPNIGPPAMPVVTAVRRKGAAARTGAGSANTRLAAGWMIQSTLLHRLAIAPQLAGSGTEAARG